MNDNSVQQPSYTILSKEEGEARSGHAYEIRPAEGVSHLGYLDESGWNNGRYRSVALVSLPEWNESQFSSELDSIAQQHGVSADFKFKKVRDEKGLRVATKWANSTVCFAQNASARLDILSWDTQDERHQVRGRNDSANLAYMNRKLTNRVLERWSYVSTESTKWILNPDSGVPFSWENEVSRLNSTNRAFDDATTNYEIVAAHETDSENCRLIQLADIFAGLARYSWHKYEEYHEWLARTTDGYVLSNTDTVRFRLIQHILNLGKSYRIPITYSQDKGLRTYPPRAGQSDALNFWPYRRRHPNDVAPMRNRISRSS